MTTSIRLQQESIIHNSEFYRYNIGGTEFLKSFEFIFAHYKSGAVDYHTLNANLIIVFEDELFTFHKSLLCNQSIITYSQIADVKYDSFLVYKHELIINKRTVQQDEHLSFMRAYIDCFNEDILDLFFGYDMDYLVASGISEEMVLFVKEAA